MDKENLTKLLEKCKAVQYGKFVLTSGAISNYYIDIKKASTNPKILKIIAKEMKKYCKGFDLVAGMEMGAIPLIVALSLETEIPYVIIRKTKKEHGTSKQIEGANVKDKKVLLIEDVTTSGGSVLKSIQIIRENKGVVDTVLTVVDRESGTKEKLKNAKVKFIPLLTKSDIIKK
jgi:orotate phosphoribosyltransferase